MYDNVIIHILLAFILNYLKIESIMKRSLLLAAGVFTIAFTSCSNKPANKYFVNMSKTGNECTIGLEAESPADGQHLGPFDTKKDAKKAMCADFDATKMDPKKCHVMTPADACDTTKSDDKE